MYNGRMYMSSMGFCFHVKGHHMQFPGDLEYQQHKMAALIFAKGQVAEGVPYWRPCSRGTKYPFAGVTFLGWALAAKPRIRSALVALPLPSLCPIFPISRVVV
jgi:hypothetical protein